MMIADNNNVKRQTAKMAEDEHMPTSITACTKSCITAIARTQLLMLSVDGIYVLQALHQILMGYLHQWMLLRSFCIQQTLSTGQLNQLLPRE